MKLDKITLELLHQKLRACTEEMALALSHAARSTYVKDAADFGTALADLDGKFFAYPEALGVSGFLDLDCGTAIAAVGALEPGDVIITNHPYSSGGLATHMPDLQLIKPYFHEGEIICYGWDFIHSADIGGGVPSSISPSFTTIFQEGLQIPPLKIVRAGVLNQDFLSLYSANCRVPEVNLADVNAMLAALTVGERRVEKIVARHGVAAFMAAQRDLVDWARQKSREVQRRIPDGEFDFWDYLDDDFNTPFPVRIRCRMTVRDGHVHLDYTGTDPQVASAYNVPTGGARHPWLTLKLMHLVGSLDSTIPLNFGLFENITVAVPRGTILNPVAPAATGVRAATAVRINDVIVGVLTRALAGLIPCPSGGTVVPVVVAERAAQSGNPVLSVIQTLVGGTGGQQGMDGIDGRDSGLANLYNTPLERSEAEVGVVIDHYGLRPDSGGPGQWRGGMGLELRLLFRKTGTSVLGRGLERFVFRPWGAAGGRPGARCQVILNAGRPNERRLGKIAELFVAPGDTLTILTAGGGGYGHPFDRDPDLVLQDVLSGLVSPEAARADYGVIVRDDALDAAATQVHRDTHRPDVPEIDFGPERAVWESVFDDRTATELALRLQHLPVGGRQATRQEILSAVLPRMSEVNTIGLAAVIDDAKAQKRALARLIDDRLPPLTQDDKDWLD